MDTPQRPATAVRWTLPLSLAVHGFALLMAAWLVVPRPLLPPPMRVISVDLVAPDAAALQTPPSPPVPMTTPAAPVARQAEAPPPAAPTSLPAAPPRSGDMVRASQFFAGDILKDPANAEVRANFPLLATDEQVVQLCNMEALEQLRLAGDDFEPDALVGYAFDSFAIDGTVLDADGGAFRSKGRWFRLRYHCEVSPEITAVSAFEYAIGDPVPESQWEEHFLNSDDDWLN